MRHPAAALIQSAVLRLLLRKADTIDLQVELHRRGWVSVTQEYLDHLKAAQKPTPKTIPIQPEPSGAWASPLLRPGKN